MGKLQGYHLVLLVLAYFATLKRDDAKIDATIQERVPGIFAKVPYLEYALVAGSIFLPSSEHVLLIWTLASGYKGALALSSDAELQPSYLAPSILIAGLLVSIYDGTLARTNLVLGYMCIAVVLVLLISAQKTNAKNVIEDVTLAHLLFYFTK